MSYDEGWRAREYAIKLWLDIFRHLDELSDLEIAALRLAEAALEGTSEPREVT